MAVPSSPGVARASAAFIFAAAGIHLVLTPEHFREEVLYGIFFLGAALVQLGLVAALLLRPSVFVFRVGVLSSGGLIATWVVTRAVSPPLAPAPEPVTFAGVIASSVELAALLLLAVALGGAASTRPPRFAKGWAVTAGLLFLLLFLLATGAHEDVVPLERQRLGIEGRPGRDQLPRPLLGPAPDRRNDDQARRPCELPRAELGEDLAQLEDRAEPVERHGTGEPDSRSTTSAGRPLRRSEGARPILASVTSS